MFSIPVSSGLNPDPNSSIDANLPFISISPEVGKATPVSNFKSVDLPAPL